MTASTSRLYSPRLHPSFFVFGARRHTAGAFSSANESATVARLLLTATAELPPLASVVASA